MKRKIFLTALTLAALSAPSLQAQAQSTAQGIAQAATPELKIKIDPKGRIGFVNPQGQVVTACQYSSAQPFEGGLSIVSKGEKFGAVNEQGLEVVKPQYDEVSRWGQGLLLVKKGKKWGLASGADGKLCVPVAYSYISRPNRYGKAWLVKGGSVVKQMTTNSQTGAQEQQTVFANAKVGIVNADGTVSIEAKQKGLFEFAKHDTGLLKGGNMIMLSGNVTMGDTCLTDCQYMGFNKTPALANSGVMDGSGNVLAKVGAHSYFTRPESGMMAWLDVSKKKHTFGFHNVQTGAEFEVLTTSVPKESSSETPVYLVAFHGQLATVSATGAGHDYKIINQQGQTLAEGFTSVQHNDLARAWCGRTATGPCQLFNDEGQPLLPQGTEVEDVNFSNTVTDGTLLAVKKGGKWGVMKVPSAQVTVPFNYKNVALHCDVAIVTNEADQQGVVNPTTAAQIVPTQYAFVFAPRQAGTTMFWCKKKSDSLWYAYDTRKKREVTAGYANATNYLHHLAFAAPKGLEVDSSQALRAQMPYNTTNEGFAKAWADSDFGCILNERGEVVATGPFYRGQFERVATLLSEQGAKPLSPSENKALLLKLTREQRTYPMKEKISEMDWDF